MDIHILDHHMIYMWYDMACTDTIVIISHQRRRWCMAKRAKEMIHTNQEKRTSSLLVIVVNDKSICWSITNPIYLPYVTLPYLTHPYPYLPYPFTHNKANKQVVLLELFSCANQSKKYVLVSSFVHVPSERDAYADRF
jgi:hypothetical protein